VGRLRPSGLAGLTAGRARLAGRRATSCAPAAALLVPLIAAGCGGGVPLEDVPSDPIAFIRQEPRYGVSNVAEFMNSISIRRERFEQEASGRTKTTLALLTVPMREMKEIPDAGFGSFPFDWSGDGLRLLIGRAARGRGGYRLFAWNRLSGAYDRLTPDSTEGAAAFGERPIRLGWVGRIFRPGFPSEAGILVYTEHEGVRALPDAVGGRDPDIAPDGRTVLFVRDHERARDRSLIFLSTLEGEEARPIARGDQARFSRDGRWIAYVSRRSGNADVWLMRADGTSKRPITATPDDEEYPAPSPDGRYVVYSSVRKRGEQDDSQLFMTRVEDGSEIQLTRSGQNGRPVW
jgi:hypothetical protein